jgi:hypothetical protein
MTKPMTMTRRMPQSTDVSLDGFMAVASAEIPPSDERGGDVIRIAGIEIPGHGVPLLAAHTHASPDGTPTVIGRCNRFERRPINWRGATVPALLAGWEWGDTSLALQYRSLWERKMLDSVSVGLSVKDIVPLNASDPWSGWDVRQSELCELSIVAVPANPAARTVMKSMGILSYEDEVTSRLDELFGLIESRDAATYRRLDDIESALSVLAEGQAKQQHAPNTSPDADVVAALKRLLNRFQQYERKSNA